MPLPLVSRETYHRLEGWGAIQNPEFRVKSHREALELDFEEMWADLRKAKRKPEAPKLPLGSDPQPELFD